MTGLDELRSTLRAEADGLTDTGLAARTDAVHGRVRIARRRRRAGVAVAAALLVGGTALTTQVLDRDGGRIEPADTVLGQEVPDHLEMLGFPYRLVDSRTATKGTVRLSGPGQDDRRAVVLVATGLGNGRASLVTDTGEFLASADADHPVSAAVVVDETTRLKVSFAGATDDRRAAVAMYAPTGEQADGVVSPDGSAVFRRDTAAGRLVASAWSLGDEPAPELTVPRDLPHGYYVATYCRSSLDGVGYAVRGLVSSDGCGDTDPDAGSGGVTPGGPVGTIRMQLTRGLDGPVVTDRPDDTLMGIAVYASRAPSDLRLDGRHLPAEVEYRGRTWRLTDTVENASRFTGVAGPEPVTGDRLVWLHASFGTNTTVRVVDRSGGQVRDLPVAYSVPPGPTSIPLGIFPGGGDDELRGPSGGTVGLAIYAPVG